METNNLKISVIIPVYNSEPFLEKCLESVVKQSYADLDIIIIDDGSTDDSYTICDKYALSDDRIRLFRQENRGLVYTRRFGIDVAVGDYIAFVDADDYIEPDMFAQLLSSMKACPDMMAFGLKEVYSDHITKKMNKYEPGIYDRKRLEAEVFPSMLSYGSFFDFGILPNLVCKLIKRQFLKRCHFSVSDIVSVGEDADMTFQLMAQAQSLEIVEGYPYHYCKRDGTMMWRGIKKEALEVLEADLKNSFLELGVYRIMEHQLEDYITFIKLLKNPMSIQKVDSIFSKENIRIALYGAGGFGQALYNQYTDKVSIWIDKNYRTYADKGMAVVSIDEMIQRERQYDMIYIAILNSEICEAICEQLKEQGIKKPILYMNAI